MIPFIIVPIMPMEKSGGLTLIGRGPEGDTKEVAVEERVLVVAAGRAHAVGAAGVRVKGTAREVADRRDIEPVELACWQDRQGNAQPGDFDLEFGKPEPAPARRSNYRRWLSCRWPPMCRLW